MFSFKFCHTLHNSCSLEKDAINKYALYFLRVPNSRLYVLKCTNPLLAKDSSIFLSKPLCLADLVHFCEKRANSTVFATPLSKILWLSLHRNLGHRSKLVDCLYLPKVLHFARKQWKFFLHRHQ